MLSDNDRVVGRNLTTAHVLLDSNSAQRKEFWSVRRLVCNNNGPAMISGSTLMIVEGDEPRVMQCPKHCLPYDHDDVQNIHVHVFQLVLARIETLPELG